MNAAHAVLAINSGSTSLKLALLTNQQGEEQLVLSGTAEGIGQNNGTLRLEGADGQIYLRQEHIFESQTEALERLVSAMRPHLPEPLAAVGHRVVHGGPTLLYHQPVTPLLLEELSNAVHFAPLHIPEALRSIRRAQELFPEPVHFACLDTAFHRTMPESSTRLPIPKRFAEQGVRRYGFHGLSCESVISRLGPQVPARVVIAHLGGGCSVTAIQNGRSLDNSMGMSPTGGLPMATRSGDLDPAVLLFLLRSGLTADGVEQAVNHECGLYGLSDGEPDMQELERRAVAGDSAAKLALEIFCAAVGRAIGGAILRLGGVDSLIFTGGIGEHSETVRARVCEELRPFAISDEAQPGKRVVALPAQEEPQIARICRRLLKA